MSVVFSCAFLNELASPNEGQVHRFRETGFRIISSIIDLKTVASVLDAFEDVFAGKFETGSYPDSWQWQRGTSYEHLPRHALNGWKCDRRIAQVVTAEPIAAMAARLMGWRGARLATDSIWMKPPGWQSGGFHQDTLAAFTPAETITCWVTLGPVSERNGSLVYVCGSHRWQQHDLGEPDCNPGERTQSDVAALGEAQGEQVNFHTIEAPPGSISFHHGLTWHGSHANRTESWRNALGIHLIRADARFSPDRVGFIFSRYKKNGKCDLDENFFPVLSGKRSAFVDRYCQTGICG